MFNGENLKEKLIYRSYSSVDKLVLPAQKLGMTIQTP
jgi:hypothetical protein